MNTDSISDDEFIICPYCRYSRRAEACDGDNDPCIVDEDCEHCGETFQRCAEISVTYHTEKKR